MAYMIKTGSILIKDGTVLPDALRFESEPFASGWKLVKNLDGYGLNRKIDESGWTFFSLAGEIQATVFGMDGEKMARRAIERILANPKSEKFNSLQIDRVVSEHFLGVPYMSVYAHSRHIQESMFLFRAKDPQDHGPIKVCGRLNPIAMFPSPKESLREDLIAQPAGPRFLNSKILGEMFE